MSTKMFSRTLFLFSIILAFKLIDGQRRIFGGYDLRYDVHKHLVRLELNKNKAQHTSTCSGSIISANWIITAAHCINSEDLGYVNVTQGIENNVIAIVNKDDAHRYPEYYFGHVIRDVALLHVRQGIEFNEYVQPIELATEEPENGKIGIIAGYGQTEPNLKAPKEGPVVISHCPDHDGNVICTKGPVRAGPGDSGGPLSLNGKLVGIISTSCTNAPINNMCLSKYASVVANIKWIQLITNTVF